jgi:cytochrome c
MTNRVIKFLLSLSAITLILSPMVTQAADGAALYKSKTCVACHGKDGKSPVLPNYPKIAGQNEAYVLQQMKDIKSGARSNGQSAAMKGVMHLVSDEEIQALAKYVASLTP